MPIITCIMQICFQDQMQRKQNSGFPPRSTKYPFSRHIVGTALSMVDGTQKPLRLQINCLVVKPLLNLDKFTTFSSMARGSLQTCSMGRITKILSCFQTLLSPKMKSLRSKSTITYSCQQLQLKSHSILNMTVSQDSHLILMKFVQKSSILCTRCSRKA